MSYIGPAGQTPSRWFTNATQRWQNPSLKLLRLNQAPSIVAINNSVENLVATGFTPPNWEELSRSTVEAPAPVDEEPNQPRVGWQAVAWSRPFLKVVLPTLSDPDIALLKSQGGLLASAVSFPTSRATRLEPQVLKVLFSPSFASPTPPHSSRLPVQPSSRHLCTTGRRVLWHEFSGAEGFLWKLQRQESAVNQVGEFAQTFLFETWTWAWSTSSTPGGLRWWWMGCLFSKELKSRRTRRSCVR